MPGNGARISTYTDHEGDCQGATDSAGTAAKNSSHTTRAGSTHERRADTPESCAAEIGCRKNLPRTSRAERQYGRRRLTTLDRSFQDQTR